MSRFEQLKKFDIKKRNKIRAILSDKKNNAIPHLVQLVSLMEASQVATLDEILKSPQLTNAFKTPALFPKRAQFTDTLQVYRDRDLNTLLSLIEKNVLKNIERLTNLSNALNKIDMMYACKDIEGCIDLIIRTIDKDGWSHAILRRIILIRENLEHNVTNEKIEDLVLKAGIKNVVVSSLIQTFTHDQSILISKRSILNINDRGSINRYTRTLARLSVQPFSSSKEELKNFLQEVIKCSLIDAIILAKFNCHLINLSDYPALSTICNILGRHENFEHLISTYDCESTEGEYIFYKQSSAWLEYEQVRCYRILMDNYYDSSQENNVALPVELKQTLVNWIGDPTPRELARGSNFTSHKIPALQKLEVSGHVTRSALFNYWLAESEGEVGFEKEDLFSLMGLTRDLARTIPIKAVRTAAKLANDKLVKLIMLLLLAKRSKNELDNFHLRKLLEEVTLKNHNGSLVELIKTYESTHPYIAEYIYEIATEDFLAKLTRLAPHRADIPEIRASLHEWMAGFSGDEYYLQRARAVRIDHQINRVRDEIDDHRIYVDPMRFTSWLEDEMMLELNSALTSTGSGKKGVSLTYDETILSMVMKQSYNTFCSNIVFGIASYIGRRIRHGTFHGQMYSSIINHLEKSDKYHKLLSNQQFLTRWHIWKDLYNSAVEEIIAERLHVQSKNKPNGLLTPEVYCPIKQEILSSAVATIINIYSETISTADISPTIIDYCWRLAELDLTGVTRYLKAQQKPLKNESYFDEDLMPVAVAIDRQLAESFRRELEHLIDRKISMMCGWFKRPSIVAPKASVALLFAATVEEVKDTIPSFDPQDADSSSEDIELVGNFYHLIYDALAIVVGNAAKHADPNHPLKRNFEIISGKEKQLIIELSSTIKATDDPLDVSRNIEARKLADYHDANMYDRKSGISKLLLLASNRKDFELNQYEVIGNEVKVRLSYVLVH
ncbi:hypothetical protein ACVR25_000880 [Cronobacter sakazakii]|nr:hypothetical protein [Cronobacter sakazakii]ELY4362537.1 hypothetical protein [Cronobacter sakazakii]ELY6235990.1 hypothetical protein [Cronobacter sakazakii]